MSPPKLVVISDRYFCGFTVFEVEADLPLIIDTNGYLPGSIAFEFLQSITSRHIKINPGRCRIDPPKLIQRPLLNLRRQLRRKPLVPNLFGLFVAKGRNHGNIITLCVNIVKRQYRPAPDNRVCIISRIIPHKNSAMFQSLQNPSFPQSSLPFSFCVPRCPPSSASTIEMATLLLSSTSVTSSRNCSHGKRLDKRRGSGASSQSIPDRTCHDYHKR